MKIALITLANGPDHQRYTKYIADGLEDNEVMVVGTTQFDTVLAPSIKVETSLQCSKSRLEKESLSPAIWKKIFNEIQLFSPDIIHFLTAHPLNIILSARFRSIHQVFTIHDVKPHPGEKVSALITIYNKIVKKLANTLVVHSKLAKEELGVPEKTHVMPLAAKPAVFSKLSINHPKILFFGRIRPYKGVDIFVKAACKVQQSHKNAEFVIAGNGSLQDIETGFITVINKFITEKEADELFQQAFIVVLPYKSATQSGVIPVAFSYGKPVVATRVGALSETITDGYNGFLTSPDPNSLACAIEKLLDDEKTYNSMAQNALKTYNRFFTPVIMGSEFARFYKSLL